MKPILLIGALGAALAAPLVPGQAFAQQNAPHSVDSGQPWGLMDKFCSDCHNSEDWAGGVAFDLLSRDALHEEAEVWEQAIRKLRGRLMPPPGSEQPEQADIDAFVSWMENSLDQHSDQRAAGHVPVQRLNRTEYARAVKDLLAVEIDPEDYLPMDIEVDGFDNIASALSVSPTFLDQYINLARRVSRLAVGEATPKTERVYYPITSSSDQDHYIEGMPQGTRGGMQVKHHFPADGTYHLNVLDLDVGLYPRSLESRQTLVVLVDGEEVFREHIGGKEDLALVNIGGAPGRAKIMERFSNIPIPVKAGTREITVTFIERGRMETAEPIGGFVAYGGFSFEGALRVPRLLNGIEVIGPFQPSGISSTPSREKVFICKPQSAEEEILCARRITENLARRAYRRPVDVEDLDSLMPFYEQARDRGEGFNAGIRQMVAAVLSSPDFLYRGISPKRDIGDARVFALSDLELASRLSFFLWSQGPDDELLTLAANNALSQPEVLEEQVRRMLADPRAANLVNNFTLKWLNLDELDAVVPDPALYPGFDDELREDFSEELTRFIASILLEDRPVTDLLSAQHTFLNERLARHYGITSVHGTQFRRVTLKDERRWGLLGKGAVLLRTSYGDRTSPVLRGAWVLEKLMGTPPSPPPPNVETDLTVPDGEQPTTVRARLEQHRDNPSCNQCHGVIDPIGLALENFNVTGQWRDQDREAQQPINARTVLPTGVAINGPVELRQELQRRPEQFVQAMTEKLLMYALGRELEYFDMPQVRAIVRNAQQEDFRLSALVLGIVNSDAFRLQSLPHRSEEMQKKVVGGLQ